MRGALAICLLLLLRSLLQTFRPVPVPMPIDVPTPTPRPVRTSIGLQQLTSPSSPVQSGLTLEAEQQAPSRALQPQH
jgi:hypothetical protein